MHMNSWYEVGKFTFHERNKKRTQTFILKVYSADQCMGFSKEPTSLLEMENLRPCS